MAFLKHWSRKPNQGRSLLRMTKNVHQALRKKINSYIGVLLKISRMLGWTLRTNMTLCHRTVPWRLLSFYTMCPIIKKRRCSRKKINRQWRLLPHSFNQTAKVTQIIRVGYRRNSGTMVESAVKVKRLTWSCNSNSNRLWCSLISRIHCKRTWSSTIYRMTCRSFHLWWI